MCVMRGPDVDSQLEVTDEVTEADVDHHALVVDPDEPLTPLDD
jgi:hypothetical protein